jgi:hypothetical protein
MRQSKPRRIQATNDTLKNIVRAQIEKYGNHADLNHIDVSKVTDFSELFNNSAFNGDISQWNVAHARNMDRMFYRSRFNGDISQWNVSALSSSASMFENSAFNGDISQWKPTSLFDARRMFKNSAFEGDVGRWKCSKLKLMREMFYGSQSVTGIGKWKIKMDSVADAVSMFAYSKVHDDFSSWIQSKEALLTSACGMFQNNTSFPFNHQNLKLVQHQEHLVSLYQSYPASITESIYLERLNAMPKLLTAHFLVEYVHPNTIASSLLSEEVRTNISRLRTIENITGTLDVNALLNIATTSISTSIELPSMDEHGF